MIFKPSFIEGGDCIFCKVLTLHMHCTPHRKIVSVRMKYSTERKAERERREGGSSLLADADICHIIAAGNRDHSGGRKWEDK